MSQETQISRFVQLNRLYAQKHEICQKHEKSSNKHSRTLPINAESQTVLIGPIFSS